MGEAGVEMGWTGRGYAISWAEVGRNLVGPLPSMPSVLRAPRSRAPRGREAMSGGPSSLALGQEVGNEPASDRVRTLEHSDDVEDVVGIKLADGPSDGVGATVVWIPGGVEFGANLDRDGGSISAGHAIIPEFHHFRNVTGRRSNRRGEY